MIDIETDASAAAAAPASNPAAEPQAASPASSTGAASAAPADIPLHTGSAARPGKALASPAVRHLARSHQIDISQVPGSGKNGRVIKGT